MIWVIFLITLKWSCQSAKIKYYQTINNVHIIGFLVFIYYNCGIVDAKSVCELYLNLSIDFKILNYFIKTGIINIENEI